MEYCTEGGDKRRWGGVTLGMGMGMAWHGNRIGMGRVKLRRQRR